MEAGGTEHRECFQKFHPGKKGIGAHVAESGGCRMGETKNSYKIKRMKHKEVGGENPREEEQWVEWGGYWTLWWDILWVATGVVGLQLKNLQEF